MAGALSPVVRYVVMDGGVVAPGAKLYTYLSGTSTPQSVYNNADLAPGHAHTNPVVADADGVLPVIYFAAVSYRVLVTDSTGATIFPAQDDVSDLFQVFQATTVTANRIYAGPSSGVPAAPTFRALVQADMAAEQKWTRLTTTATGTQNNLALSSANLLICNNASTLTITGFSALPLSPGKPLTIVAIGTGAVVLKNENASSDAENRITTNSTTIDIALMPTRGRATLVYNDVSLRWVLIDHEQGEWNTWTPTWSNSGTANSLGNGTIAGLYYQRGHELWFQITMTFGSTTTSGNGNWQFNFPGTVNTTMVQVGQVHCLDAGTARYLGFNLLLSATLFGPYADVSAAGGAMTPVTAIAPFVWATADVIDCWGLAWIT